MQVMAEELADSRGAHNKLGMRYIPLSARDAFRSGGEGGWRARDLIYKFVSGVKAE